MKIYRREFSRSDLLRRIGHLAQVGGVQLLRAEDGPAQGVRYLEFRLGSGFNFKIALERGMDIGYCEYRGMPLGWIPSTLLPGGWYFEQQTEFGWLRTAMGGLCTSCGMLHIGNPESDSIAHYNFPARENERYGVHDRLAMLPAQLTGYGERWEGDECELFAAGKIIQSQVYAENLVLYRSYNAKMGEKHFTLHDRIVNEGHYPTTVMLLYHLNVGFPFVDEGSRFLTNLEKPTEMIAGSSNANVAASFDAFSAPQQAAPLQVYSLTPKAGPDGFASLAILQPPYSADQSAIFVRYKPAQFPRLFETRMMGEGHYFVSLEPSTNEFGRAEVRNQGEQRILQPGEACEFDTQIGVLEGQPEIEAFQESMK